MKIKLFPTRNSICFVWEILIIFTLVVITNDLKFNLIKLNLISIIKNNLIIALALKNRFIYLLKRQIHREERERGRLFIH